MANWFSYNGNGNPHSADNYYRMNLKPSCISGGTMICAVYLDDSSTSTPSAGSFTTAINGYIADALATLVSQPSNGFKRYVYVKSC